MIAAIILLRFRVSESNIMNYYIAVSKKIIYCKRSKSLVDHLYFSCEKRKLCITPHE